MWCLQMCPFPISEWRRSEQAEECSLGRSPDVGEAPDVGHVSCDPIDKVYGWEVFYPFEIELTSKEDLPLGLVINV